jgi:hypothetical protein
MKSAYKKIASAVCLWGGLMGLGYMGLKHQNTRNTPESRPTVVQAEEPVVQAEVPTPEASQTTSIPATNLLVTSHPLHTVTRLTVATIADVEIFKAENPSFEIVGGSQELIDTIKTDYVKGNLILSHELTKSLKLKCGGTSITMDVNGNSTSMTVNTGKKEKSTPCALVKIGVKNIPEILIQKSGNVQVAGVDQQVLVLQINGSGSITADGKVKELLIRIQGSGDVDTTKVVTNKALILSQGSGDVTAIGNGELQSVLQGSGDITVIGSPVSPQHVETGSGRFRLIGSASK